MSDAIAVDVAGAAALLGVSERTIDELEAEGRIHRVDFGPRRIRRFAIAELRRFADEPGTYHPAEEDDDGTTTGRRREAVQAQGRQVPGRRPARPRRKRSPGAPLPLRSVG